MRMKIATKDDKENGKKRISCHKLVLLLWRRNCMHKAAEKSLTISLGAFSTGSAAIDLLDAPLALACRAACTEGLRGCLDAKSP